jgi:multiple sugar transport system substrate-binding protein
MAYSQTKYPKQVMSFMTWLSEHEKTLWTQGASGMLPARASFLQDPFFSGNAITKAIIDEYLPVSKNLFATSKEAFPELNEVEGDGFLQTLTQQLWQGKPVDEVLPAAQQRLSDIRNDK